MNGKEEGEDRGREGENMKKWRRKRWESMRRTKSEEEFVCERKTDRETGGNHCSSNLKQVEI